MATYKEKIGYGFGDMSSSMFWKIFSYYLPIFYSDIFGLDLVTTGTLMLVTRVWDTVSDPMMGVIADRTQTRWGKYRPYLLWFAVPFALAGCLLFTTPDVSQQGKTLWAYFTYILMMTVYTGINVPYGSMLGVISSDSNEKTVFSSYRMAFAYAGSFIALFAWEPLCSLFGGSSEASIEMQQAGWQHAMFVIAGFCIVMFLLSFALTQEHIKPEPPESIWKDFGKLVRNAPWWLLTAAALCTNLFNTMRGATVAYYFKYYLGDLSTMFITAGVFLAAGEIANMVGIIFCTVPLTQKFGKKPTFIFCGLALAALSVLFFFMPASGTGLICMFVLQILINILTGIISPLVWSMYADVADYSLAKSGSASTGLIFSSGSMAQKFGGAIAGSAVMWLLAGFGLTPNAASQTDTAILGMKLTMSIFPALVALLMAFIVLRYPLDRQQMKDIEAQLKK